ncbi:MAG: hypothetical protein ACI9EF_001107 [Pseudohongiellaceae bacterium]|jgi:hypothetical protein
MKSLWPSVLLLLLVSVGSPEGWAQSALPSGFDEISLESVEAVDEALAFLASIQNGDGSWSADVGYKLNQSYEISERTVPHVGVTALAGLAYLSAGHLPSRGLYAKQIGQATDWLLSQIGDNGYISTSGSRMYSHAFAALFLAEVYGTTDRDEIREELQRAIDFIVSCQNTHGSWRYAPLASESDMSITVCQLNALRAARNVGIRVPRSTIDRAKDYIARSYVDRNMGFGGRGSYYQLGRGSFKYQVSRSTRSSFALTSAGLAALHSAGVDDLHFTWELQDGQSLDIDLNQSIQFLRDTIGSVSDGSPYENHFFYWYGHYYATQALYVIGGEAWAWYYPLITDELLRNQRSSGAFPCRTGPGEAFSTAVASIILSLPYGYLPIFQR